MANIVKNQRYAVRQIRNIPTARAFEWLGPKRFKRIIAHRKYDTLRNILNSPLEFQAFCSAIGWVEVNWALMESQLDRWCQVIFVNLKWRGKDGKEKEIPRPYGRKVRYLRGAFSKVPALKKYAADGVSILNRADKLSDTRHDLTHGVITHLEAKNGKYFLENRKIQRDGSHIIKNVVFDARDFPSLAGKLAALGGDAILVSRRLADEFLMP